jgi:hypothetical protein
MASVSSAISPTGSKLQVMHSRQHLNAGGLAKVQCSHQANVLLMDDENFRNFLDGHLFYYYGGFYRKFPVQLVIPETGDWNVALHLGGLVAQISYSITFQNRDTPLPPGSIPPPRRSDAGR